MLGKKTSNRGRNFLVWLAPNELAKRVGLYSTPVLPGQKNHNRQFRVWILQDTFKVHKMRFQIMKKKLLAKKNPQNLQKVTARMPVTERKCSFPSQS